MAVAVAMSNATELSARPNNLKPLDSGGLTTKDIESIEQEEKERFRHFRPRN